MPALAYTDVSVTKIDEDLLSIANKMIILDLTFGDGSLTYTSGGIPITSGGLGKLGFQKTIKFAQVSPPAANGYIYKWSYSDTAPKIRIYQSVAVSASAHTHSIATHSHTVATHTHTVAVPSGTASASVTTSNPSVTLSAATGGTTTTGSGGAVSQAAAALAELGSVAVSSTTVRVMLIGE